MYLKVIKVKPEASVQEERWRSAKILLMMMMIITIINMISIRIMNIMVIIIMLKPEASVQDNENRDRLCPRSQNRAMGGS